MKVRVSDYIAEYVERLGVDSVFLLSGGGMMHLLDAISRRPNIKMICQHHEQACGMAAEAYARRSGRLGLSYATSGPGGTNTVTAVAGAWLDSAPVLFISGQSKVSQTIEGTHMHGLRQFGTFEVDIIPIVQSITKYSAFIDDPCLVKYHLEKACALAREGRPGPVFLDIPVDIQGALIDPDQLQGYQSSVPTRVLTDAVIDDVIRRIASAKRPLILAGHGVRASGAVEEFRSVLNKLNTPAVTTQLGLDILPYENPLFVGRPGMKGDRPGNFAVQNADLILSIGSSLHVTTTGYELDQFAPKAYLIQVDPDGQVMKREQVNVQKKIQCEVDVFLKRLSSRLESGATGLKAPLHQVGAWHERCHLWKRELAVRNEPHKHQGDQINYYDIVDALSDSTSGDETITTDAGSAFYVVGQAFRPKGNQRVIISGGLGSMGYALPAATGSYFADPKGKVICITGDGSLQTNIHECAVIRHHHANVKVFVVNNNGYVSIRNTQNNFFAGHLAGTDPSSGVSFPSLEKLAVAYEIPYFSARKLADLKDTVNFALNTVGPVICEIFIPTEQEIIPTVSSVKLADGSMKSKPLHDMYPFMDEATFKRYMLS